MSTQFQPQRVTGRRLRQRTSTHSIKGDDQDNLTVMVLRTVKPLFRKPPRKRLNQESQKSDILVDDTRRNQLKHGGTTTGLTPKHTHINTQMIKRMAQLTHNVHRGKHLRKQLQGQHKTEQVRHGCPPSTRPFLLASNPVGTFRFNYNTNKIKVGPGVTQRARNTSLQGKI